MSRVPYYTPRASSLPPFGNVTAEDGLIKDGLWDVYNKFHMGVCAETTAKKYEITREMQDQYAVQSYTRAQQAWKDGAFKDEIAPVTVKGRKGETIIDTDEGYLDVKFDKVPTLKPAFVRDGTGTVTAANSSTFNDGASALVLGNKAIAQQYGAGSRVLARICGSADAAIDPVDFPVAPAKAVPLALERAGIKQEDVAVWEFNEAFAAVIKANEKVCFVFLCLFHAFCILTWNVDPRIGKRKGQFTRRSYLFGACIGKFWIKNLDYTITSIEAGRVWCCSNLQWRGCCYGYCCAAN